MIVHGAPAVGKLTIARCVHSSLGGLLYDNHSSLELIKPKIPYGAPGFSDAVWCERVTFFRHAFEEKQNVVFTLAYDPRKHTDRLSKIVDLGKAFNVNLFMAYLHCDTAERLKRATNPTRQNAGKADAATLREVEKQSRFERIPGAHLTIDTGIYCAQESCEKILEQIRSLR